MHTIDPKHEAVSLAPPTTYTKIAHYSIKMALSWLIINLLDCSILCMPLHIVASIP